MSQQILTIQLLQDLIQQKRDNPDNVVLLNSPRDQATYFMAAGFVTAEDNYKLRPYEPWSDIHFAIGIMQDQVPIDPETNQPDLGFVEQFHFKANNSFRAALSRNKAKLEKDGHVIGDFKALHQNHRLILDSGQPGLSLFVETYRYTFNPVSNGVLRDFLATANSLI